MGPSSGAKNSVRYVTLSVVTPVSAYSSGLDRCPLCLKEKVRIVTVRKQWRWSRSGRSGGRRKNIFAKKKKDVCLIGRLLVVFARLVERGLFVMEDPEH